MPDIPVARSEWVKLTAEELRGQVTARMAAYRAPLAPEVIAEMEELKQLARNKGAVK